MHLLAWGSNSNGQLGLGVLSEQSVLPEAVKNIQFDIKFIVGGGNHSFICDTKNRLYSCGNNDRSQLTGTQRKSTSEFLSILSLPFRGVVVKVACGWDFTLCLLESGEVYVWGSNSFGQLGLPLKEAKYIETPQKVGDRNVCVDIGSGLRHSCLVNDQGFVLCAGSNSKGQLGISGESTFTKIDSFSEVPNLRGIEKVACGENFSLAHSKDNTIFAWGDNKFGQLGEDPKTLRLSPLPRTVLLPQDQTIKKICCGWTHCSILTEKGSLISWGRSDYGQLGEKRERPWKPKLLTSDLKFEGIAVGSEHTTGVTSAGEVFSWGWNEHGNCGNGEIENVWTPTELPLPADFKVLGIGTGYAHSFAFGSFSHSRMLLLQGQVMNDCIDLNLVHDGGEKEIEKDYSHGILRFPSNITYEQFFSSCLLKNEPCILENVAEQWPCVQRWVSHNGQPDIDRLAEDYGNSVVNVARCNEKVYNVQKKIPMTLSEYNCHWQSQKNYEERSLYLKDWHFTKEYPTDDAYRVPKYFASDWLNEYYNRHPELEDDYRFVYIGPKGTWTPLHADVFTSFSWSVNVVGRKKWLLLRPGVEERFRDTLGNLYFGSNINPDSEPGVIFYVEQGPRDAIFVPSGWHHQVWNVEDTISINHNWVNGCNIMSMWTSMRKNLQEVKKEIEDCRDMDNWEEHCQLMLKALYGFDYEEFYRFLTEIINYRMTALRSEVPLIAYGSYSFSHNHLLFDINQALKALHLFFKDSDVQRLQKYGTKSLDNNFCTSVIEFLEKIKN